jgi:phosphotransferase system IIA component
MLKTFSSMIVSNLSYNTNEVSMSFLYQHPFTGNIRAITETPDEVFSLKLLGDGFVVIPSNNVIYAPITGVIETIFASKHIILIKNEDITIMLHLGLKAREDIVNWNVQIKDHVHIGDEIGQLLPHFYLQSNLDQSCNIVFLEKQSCYYHDTYITCEDL